VLLLSVRELGGEHHSRKIALQQEDSGVFLLLNVFSPADVLGSSC